MCERILEFKTITYKNYVAFVNITTSLRSDNNRKNEKSRTNYHRVNPEKVTLIILVLLVGNRNPNPNQCVWDFIKMISVVIIKHKLSKSMIKINYILHHLSFFFLIIKRSNLKLE